MALRRTVPSQGTLHLTLSRQQAVEEIDPGPGHTTHQHTMSPEPSSINSYMLQAAVYGNRITQSLHSAFFCQLKTSTWIYMPRKGTCVGECSEIRPKSNLGRDQFSYIKLNIGLWIVIIFMLTRTTKT